MRAVNEQTGRVNQKLRTRMAIVEACREVIRSGGPVTMPAVARAALVSEPTAYRYFPDLISLLNAALVGMWPSPRRSARAGHGIGGPGRTGRVRRRLLPPPRAQLPGRCPGDDLRHHHPA